MRVFGPVPSRRLGQSIGVNHIPPKICTYACRYCQLGKAIRMQTKREVFYNPDDITKQVAESLKNNPDVDYVTLVPDGEPSLDINLGKLIQSLKSLEVPVAVITNASMLWRDDVREEMSAADWVSLKVDAMDEALWRKVDRPHKSLDFEKVAAGMLDFAGSYTGQLNTETMLIHGYNDSEAVLRKNSSFISRLDPEIAYIAIPTRPPADSKVLPADERQLQLAWKIYAEKIKNVEMLIGYEGNAFASTGDFEQDILSITAVHPMREDAVMELLKKTGTHKSLLDRLVREDKLVVNSFSGERFYLRKLKKGMQI